MNWIMIILLSILLLTIIDLVIVAFHHRNFFWQVLYTFINDHYKWKRYRRLKKYLKTDTIPLIDARDYEGGNSGFAFVQYDNIIFVIQGDYLYLSSFYNHLIDDLLKRNNQ
jgi:hypothetical protein